MTDEERYVRERWKIDDFDLECSHGGSWKFKEGHPLSSIGWHGWTSEKPDALANLWQAAAVFTLEYEEKIRLVKVEIDWLSEYARGEEYAKEVRDGVYDDCLMIVEDVRWYCAAMRILAREQAALKELKRGMKE